MKKENIFIVLIFITLSAYSFINIKDVNTSTMNVLVTFSKSILPALLPFLIINQLLIKFGIIDLLAFFLQFISYPLFKISGKGASIILIGILNGFPSSVIFASMMLKEKQIDKQEAQRLINFIFFPSASFLFGALQTNINQNQLFVYLVLSIYLSGFLFLYFTSFKVKKEYIYINYNHTVSMIKEKLNNLVFIKELKDTVYFAFMTLINILGIVTVFSIPNTIISKITQSETSYVFKGFIEFSIPSIELSLININKKRITLFLCAILSFSGLSSILQASMYIEETNLSIKKFICSRIIITIISVLILFLLFSF